jgi:hypothetical protein
VLQSSRTHHLCPRREEAHKPPLDVHCTNCEHNSLGSPSEIVKGGGAVVFKPASETRGYPSIADVAARVRERTLFAAHCHTFGLDDGAFLLLELRLNLAYEVINLRCR